MSPDPPLPPGHTCVAIERAIRLVSRLVGADAVEHRARLSADLIAELERVRAENIQLRAAWAYQRDERKRLERLLR